MFLLIALCRTRSSQNVFLGRVTYEPRCRPLGTSAPYDKRPTPTSIWTSNSACPVESPPLSTTPLGPRQGILINRSHLRCTSFRHATRSALLDVCAADSQQPLEPPSFRVQAGRAPFHLLGATCSSRWLRGNVRHSHRRQAEHLRPFDPAPLSTPTRPMTFSFRLAPLHFFSPNRHTHPPTSSSPIALLSDGSFLLRLSSPIPISAPTPTDESRGMREDHKLSILPRIRPSPNSAHGYLLRHKFQLHLFVQAPPCISQGPRGTYKAARDDDSGGERRVERAPEGAALRSRTGGAPDGRPHLVSYVGRSISAAQHPSQALTTLLRFLARSPSATTQLERPEMIQIGRSVTLLR